MSVVNVLIDRGFACVGVDSLGLAPGSGTPVAVARLYPLPHLPAVVASRGSAALLPVVAVSLASMLDADFDTITDQAAHMLQVLIEQLETMQQAKLPAQEVVLVGWSPKADAMAGLVLTWRPELRRVDAEPITEMWLGEWDDEAQGPLPFEPEGHDAMVELVRLQVGHLSATVGFPAGGPVITAELTQTCCELRRWPF